MHNLSKWLSPMIIFILICIFTIPADASMGDETPFFRNCRENCRKINCTLDGLKFLKKEDRKLNFIDGILFWTCSDECQYECMWRTVRAFHERKWSTPQFYGKWPFLRTWGMQELGSVIGSLLNLMAHIVNLNILLDRVSKRQPFLWLWKLFAAVCINGWIWSTIFHARDTYFTEFMDYACAFSMVMVVFYCFGIRVLFGKSIMWRVVLTCLCITYYMNHVVYLYYEKIDYGYNMIANIAVGFLGGVGWAIWSCVQYYKGRKYTWRCFLFVLLTGASLLLEVNDFPPKFYYWDAHALWHLSTCPLPFLFYRFIIDDCAFLKICIEKKKSIH